MLTPDALHARGAQDTSMQRRCSTTTTPTAFSKRTGDLVVTGPTRTNVNDYRAILVA